MPRQLDRIKRWKDYVDHPLREEYEKKVVEIKNKHGKSFEYKLLTVFMVAVWIVPALLVLYQVLYQIIGRVAGEIEWIYWLMVIILEIPLCSIACFLWSLLESRRNSVQDKNNEKELKKLKELYKSKGLYVFTYNDLVSRCLDKNDDGEPICGVTGAYIGYGQKYSFCNKTGNCRNCKTFMKACWGDDWDGEYEME